MVLDAPKPSLLDAVCCNVDVVKGAKGFLLKTLEETSAILYDLELISFSAFSASTFFLKENEKL